MGLEKKTLNENEARILTQKLLDASLAIRTVIDNCAPLEEAAKTLTTQEHLFFLGRGLDWALACEGSLKLKEISYIHCEAYAAGEMKHGTISLISEGTWVIALMTQERLAEKMVSNIVEVRSRGARTLVISKSNISTAQGVADICFPILALDDLFTPFPAVAALQLLAYYTALYRGCDIDKPRNLAKSVTVE
jgi:glucosamine--fructose-6-phosphate aminotransferase (isomerizing)